MASPPDSPRSHGTDLTSGSVLRRLISFSLPMLLGSGLHASYSVVNAIWVGRGLGPGAMASLTTCFPIFFILMAVASGLTLASNILVAQAYGAKEWDRLRDVVRNSTVLVAGVSVICAVGGILAARWVLTAMSTPPEILEQATSYMRLLILATPCMFGVFLLSSVLRGTGDAKLPLYFQAVALASTVVMDPILMFGWLGLPKMGLNGTAVATFIAQAGTFAGLAIHMHRRKHIASPQWWPIRIDAAMTWLTLKIGVPSMAQQVLVSLGMIFVVSIVNSFGVASAAAFGIASRIDQFAYLPAMTLGMACSTLAGQNIGAGRMDRVRQTLWMGIALSCGITLIPTILALSIPSTLLLPFTKDPEVLRIGAEYLRIIGIGFLMVAAMFVSNGVINGSGRTMVTTFFTLIAFWAVRVPLSKYLAKHLDSVTGVWYGILASIAIGTALSLAYNLSGRWKRVEKVV